MNADDGHMTICAARHRQLWEIFIQNKQQSEQHSANKAKISRQGHSMLPPSAMQTPEWRQGTVARLIQIKAVINLAAARPLMRRARATS
jgi:hypothetical protein